jgi:hypothetical protein
LCPSPSPGSAVTEELAQLIGARGTDFWQSVIIGREPKITGYGIRMEARCFMQNALKPCWPASTNWQVVILSGDVHCGFSAEMDY